MISKKNVSGTLSRAVFRPKILGVKKLGLDHHVPRQSSPLSFFLFSICFVEFAVASLCQVADLSV